MGVIPIVPCRRPARRSCSCLPRKSSQYSIVSALDEVALEVDSPRMRPRVTRRGLGLWMTCINKAVYSNRYLQALTAWGCSPRNRWGPSSAKLSRWLAMLKLSINKLQAIDRSESSSEVHCEVPISSPNLRQESRWDTQV